MGGVETEKTEKKKKKKNRGYIIHTLTNLRNIYED